MPYDLANVLVIGISSRALFDLEYENTIFETENLSSFIGYQRNHESEVLKPGTGFHLVESLLKLNRSASPRQVCRQFALSCEFQSAQVGFVLLTGKGRTRWNGDAQYLTRQEIEPS
jgi:hypothetical protein